MFSTAAMAYEYVNVETTVNPNTCKKVYITIRGLDGNSNAYHEYNTEDGLHIWHRLGDGSSVICDEITDGYGDHLGEWELTLGNSENNSGNQFSAGYLVAPLTGSTNYSAKYHVSNGGVPFGSNAGEVVNVHLLAENRTAINQGYANIKFLSYPYTEKGLSIPEVPYQNAKDINKAPMDLSFLKFYDSAGADIF